MTEHVEVITLTPTTRIVVDHDDDPMNPRTEYDTPNVSFHPLTVGRNYNTLEPGRNTREHQLEVIDENAESGEALEEALEKHFARAGIAYEIHDFTADRDFVGRYVCYYDPDPDEEEQYPTTPEQQAATVRANVAEYQDYCRGEVYVVSLERVASYAEAVRMGINEFVRFEEVYEPGDDEPEWVQVESCGGFIGLELWWSPSTGRPLTEYTAELATSEIAVLTPTEQAAVQPHLDAFRAHLISIGVPVP